MYYVQAQSKLAEYLFEAVHGGAFSDALPGTILLLRFQNRMAWVQVLETGYLHCALSIKGLELQETSCHTVEAMRIEENFDSAFERPTDSGHLNRHLLSTLTPVDAHRITTYSDTRNVLTGVIDSPATVGLSMPRYPTARNSLPRQNVLVLTHPACLLAYLPAFLLARTHARR